MTEQIQTLSNIRHGKAAHYPDQAIYAQFAARSLGVSFELLSANSGLAFTISSPTAKVVFGGGRGSYFPQNTATAATLAADKYLSAIVMEHVGVPTLGGEYYFLHERHRALRAPGHERADAVAHFHALGGRAFVKPLTGSRGDFARAVCDESDLTATLDDIARYYDSIIMQRIASGDEYRIFVLDDAMLYCVRKQPPHVTGDGMTPLRDLIGRHAATLLAHGISGGALDDGANTVLRAGERRTLPGRMNRSAGGGMIFADPPEGAVDLAVKAMQALGLRAGGVDLFANIDDGAGMRVIEINANPSIRFLEDAGRDDLILTIWRHTFSAMGLLDG